MEEEDIIFSRARRRNKKRKNKRWLVILIGILIVFLLSIISAPIISNIMLNDQDVVEEDSDNNTDQSTDSGTSVDQMDDSQSDETVDPAENGTENNTDDSMNEADEVDDSETDEPKNPDEYELEFTESDEENVISSYQADWDAVKTKQTEPHTISFEQDTVDWDEMLAAATLATGVQSNDMQYLWVSGNGPGKVIATYTERATQDHFRVYIEWEANKGYRPTRVDMLEDHDQMERFSSPDDETKDNTQSDDAENEMTSDNS